MTNGGSIDYNLNRDCKRSGAPWGLDDSSPAAGNAMVQLSTDGTQRYASGYFGLTQSAPVAFDVTNVFRLTIAAAVHADGVAAPWAPRRCSAASDHNRMGVRAAAAHESVRRGRPQ